MTSKTIKVSEENYRWLLEQAAELQKERGQIITFDVVLSEQRLNKMKKKKLSELPGSWKMSDEEAKELIKEIYNERKIKSRRI